LCALCRENWVSLLVRKERYGEEKHFLPPSVCIPKTVPNAQSIGGINENSESVDGLH
jgi:hypothetical protein